MKVANGLLFCFLITIFVGCGSDNSGGTTGNDFYDDTGKIVSCDLVSSGTVTANSRTITVKVFVDHNLNTVNAKTAANGVLAKFIGSGGSESLYGWVTSIYGAEWGSTIYSNLISDSKTISVVMFDIDGDGESGTGGAFTVGYFWARDNYIRNSSHSVLKYSNQTVMFAIDLPFMLKKTSSEPTWSADGLYPKEVYSTLAHEFQHMIHFYQKYIVYSATGEDDTWIDEMCSVATEDFVADKLNVQGPRGILNVNDTGSIENEDGRLPLFNGKNDDSLMTWNNSVIDYSVVYGFGSYLSRNFGGPDLFRRMVQTSNVNTNALLNAILEKGTTETLESLMRQWGAAVVLSDVTSPSGNIKYNTGGVQTHSLNSMNYNLGPINLYNYVCETYSGSSGPHYLSNLLSSIVSLFKSTVSAENDPDVGLHKRLPGKPEIFESTKELINLLNEDKSFRKSSSVMSYAPTNVQPSVVGDAGTDWPATANSIRYIGSTSLTITPQAGNKHIYFIISNPTTSTQTASISGGYSKTVYPSATSNVYINAGTISGATTYNFSLPTDVVITAVAR
jgi:Peptidase M30